MDNLPVYGNWTRKAFSMSDNNNNQDKGNGAVGFILLALLVVALGIGAWFVMKKPAVPPEAAVTTTTLPPEASAPAPESQIAADATSPEQTMAPAQSTPDMSAPSDTSASSDTTVDVMKAMAPRTLGNPNAPIKIVEYASLTCSHCAHFANDVFPELKAKYIDTGKVFYEYRDFPLNDPALRATIAAHCLPENRFADFVAMLFKTQAQWSDGIDYMTHLKQNAKLAGLSDEKFDACQDNPALKMKIAEVMQTAQDKWKVAATPTFIINDGKKTISGAQPLDAFEAAFREITNGAVGAAPKVQ